MRGVVSLTVPNEHYDDAAARQEQILRRMRFRHRAHGPLLHLVEHLHWLRKPQIVYLLFVESFDFGFAVNCLHCEVSRLFLPFCSSIDSVLSRSLREEIPTNSACEVVEAILSYNYFFPTILCGILVLVCVGLGALLVEQTINIFTNKVI